MSELTSIATLAPQDGLRLGTVGPPIPGLEVRIADDGEVPVRGETVMAGYRKAPKKTAEAIDAERWLHTRDVGELDGAGYLKRFRVLPCDWPPAGDELTPTMKLERGPITEKYAREIQALYAGG
jgi:long-subunit acyl-CoA synthetase (AMP-forming)